MRCERRVGLAATAMAVTAPGRPRVALHQPAARRGRGWGRQRPVGGVATLAGAAWRWPPPHAAVAGSFPRASHPVAGPSPPPLMGPAQQPHLSGSGPVMRSTRHMSPLLQQRLPVGQNLSMVRCMNARRPVRMNWSMAPIAKPASSLRAQGRGRRGGHGVPSDPARTPVSLHRPRAAAQRRYMPQLHSSPRQRPRQAAASLFRGLDAQHAGAPGKGGARGHGHLRELFRLARERKAQGKGVLGSDVMRRCG